MQSINLVPQKANVSLSKISQKSMTDLKSQLAVQQILFIDAQLPNYQALVAGIFPGIEVILLDSQQNGIQQITRTLSNYSYISTIHIVSHGAPGCLFLGNTQLSLDTLSTYTDQLQGWFSKILLKQDSARSIPTLLLYGCNVAVGDAGAELIERLHRLTGAEVAASSTKVGHTDQGGNWQLDAKTSEFEILQLFTPAAQRNWQGVLPVISGQAFLDFDADGVKRATALDLDTVDDGIDGNSVDGADEAVAEDIGVGGVTVRAFGPDGVQIGPDVITDVDGNYTLTVPDNTSVRLEFVNVPEQFSNGNLSGASADVISNVTFIEAGTTDLTANLSLYRPSDYLDTTTVPRLVTTCFVFSSDPNAVNQPAIVDFVYTVNQDISTNGTGFPNPDPAPTKRTLATIGNVGATYGLAFHNEADDLFAGAFQRRHTDIGPEGNDAIYRLDGVAGGTPAITPFINLDDFFGADSAGPLSHDRNNFNSDGPAFDAVGKVALGDVELSEDRQFVWTVNLNDRRLYKIPVGTAADPTTPVDYALGDTRPIERYNLVEGINPPDPTDPNEGTGIDFSASVPDDVRPFGMAIQDGLIYLGFVDSAESTQNANDLEAYVYSFDPETETFSTAPVLSFPLTYQRSIKHALTPDDGNAGFPSEWTYWRNDFSDLTFRNQTSADLAWTVEVQPMLTDITFDNNGDMVLGLADRTSYQMGRSPVDVNGNPPAGVTDFDITSGGEILRATTNGDDTWTIEPHVADAAGNPGTDRNSEFYKGEFFQNPVATTTSHEETAQGGLAQVPGYNSVATTAMDPAWFFSGGVIKLENEDVPRGDSQTSRTELFARRGNPDPNAFFNKASGLGDLEYYSSLAPNTVFGDRIWNDLNGNGLQDAGEPGFDGVTVQLFDSSGVQVGADVTTTVDDPATPEINEGGRFIFSVPTTGAGSLVPGGTYEIRVVAATIPAGTSLSPANVNGNANDNIDSDATLVDAIPTISFTVGDFGDNNYDLDIGFTQIQLDFGDAPNAFGTLLANNGPRHTIIAGLQIGAVAPDNDTDGFGDGLEDTANPGTEDDTKGTAPDDEDTFTTLPALAVGSTTYTLSVPVTNTLGSAANLVGWIDFDGSGTFEIGEAATVAVPDGTNGTTVDLTWNTIPALTQGDTFARLRLSTDTILPPVGAASNGEVEDYPLSIVQPLDFGDAPTTYGTLLADNGPNHGIVSGLQIGPAAPDADTDGFGDGTPDLAAPGTEDDTNGINDENTFPSLPALTVGDATYTLTVPVTNTVGAATLVGWIDFNQNGTFEATEGVTATVAANATTAALTWSAANSDLENVVAGTTYVRLRLSTDALTTANFGGTATNGEVEDYQLTVNPATLLDFGDAPATFGTPSHGIDPNIGLGVAVIDAELASQPTADADGDDTTGTDDEDAFTTLPTLTTNATTYSVDVLVTNTTGSDATLRGWIDFDGSGTFEADEAVSTLVADGATTATLIWDATSAPGFAGIVGGVSFARFRISTAANITATNVAPDGEVEDYQLTIQVLQPPVALDESAITPIDVPVFVNILERDFDPEDQPIALSRITQEPTNGSVIINNNGTPTDQTDDFVIYTPNAGFTGTDDFTYEIVDPDGLTDTAVVTITVRPPSPLVDDFSSTPINTPRDIDVLSNDPDSPTGPFGLVSTTDGSNGTVAINNNGTPGDPTDDFVTYTPDPGFTGQDNFTYTAVDPSGNPFVANVIVNVSDTVPLAAPDRNITAPSTPVTIDALGNDSDPNDSPLEIVDFTNPTSGTAVIDDNGTPTDPTDDQFIYTPNPGFVGTDTFTYTIQNATGQQSLTTVNVTIVSPNNPPVANDNSAITLLNTPVTVDALSNDSDPDGDPLSITEFDLTSNRGGTVALDNNRFVYTPPRGFVGSDSFTYTITDGNGGFDTATVIISVNSLIIIDDNNPPVANDNTAVTLVDRPVTVPVLENDSDPDDDPISISQFDPNSANGGTITQDGDQLIYTPPAGFIGTDTFTYQISDGNGGFDTATVTITVNSGIAPIPPDCPECPEPPSPEPITILPPPAPPEEILPIRPSAATNTIEGTPGSDVLQGTEEADQIDGLGGNDILLAEAGNDTILSGTGNDGSLGSEGDDLIYGDPGSDFLKGDTGNDTLIGGVTGAPIDTLDPDPDLIQADDGDDLLAGARGDDTLNGGRGNDLIFGGQDDDLVLAELGNDTLLGEQGDDVLLGGTSNAPGVPRDLAGQDLLFGGEGNDTLFGNQNNDTLVGNEGNDQVHGGQNDDLMDGNEGNDTLFGELGDDVLVGGPSGAEPLGDAGEQDVIFGNEGNDVIAGNLGQDTLNGGEADDNVRGGKDNDLVLGELGNDTLLGEEGDDTIFGGTFNEADAPVRDADGADLIFGGGGNDRIDGNEGDDQIIAGEGNDTAFGGQDNDFLWGEAGDDFLLGDNGNDTLCGNAGNDTLRGDPIDDGDSPAVGANGQQDKLYGGEGDDLLFGDEGRDELCGNEDNDTLFGGKDDDIAWGGEGNDSLLGDEGNDTLVGGEGADTLIGGEGADLFVFFSGDSGNLIRDFELEQDQIVLGDGLTFSQLTLTDDGRGNTNILVGDQLLVTLSEVAVDDLTADRFLSF
ncbi:MAG: tandem-95 repeat protein [Oscillatoriales cyanobacterium RM2_1_1]|nr:tandem-95 repeat protein [Oscillatoriales cyanobacterium SM2_3_0]NJO45324.1 tandem-95 repeat protein [Oscillatoriales cyanobacterium RM2_1_1]